MILSTIKHLLCVGDGYDKCPFPQGCFARRRAEDREKSDRNALQGRLRSIGTTRCHKCGDRGYNGPGVPRRFMMRTVDIGPLTCKSRMYACGSLGERGRVRVIDRWRKEESTKPWKYLGGNNSPF